MDNSFFYKFVIAILLGAFLGLERQINHKINQSKPIVGVRTFTLITALGTIGGYLFHVAPFLFYINSSIVGLLIVAYYVFDSYQNKDFGITTEIALLFSYSIGILIALNILPLLSIIGVCIILTLILSQKKRIGNYIAGIRKEELSSFISYAIISLVILPLLPNTSITLSKIPQLITFLNKNNIPIQHLTRIEIINPFTLWFIVAVITGVELIGYIFERIIGKHTGWLVTSFVGGFISSTATTQSIAQQTKNVSVTNYLVAAAIVTSLASFIQHIILIFPLNFTLFLKSFPFMIFMILSSILLTLYFLKFNVSSPQTDKMVITSRRHEKLFNLSSALKFAILYLVIKFVSSIALVLFSNYGFLISVALGSITGMDAVFVTIAELAGKTISYQFALISLLVANGINLFAKSCYCLLLGKREFALQFALSIILIILSGFLGLLV